MGNCKEDEINMSRSNNKIDAFSSIYNILEFVSSMTDSIGKVDYDIYVHNSGISLFIQ
jgi:hypothetical protein